MLKSSILSVEKFIENRPDMSVHSELSIESAINQSYGILDSETNGLLGKVWEYNFVDGSFLRGQEELKRTEWELSQLVEAMIVQTQFMLNNGNDLSQGGGSYSMGNVNASWSKPVDRDIVAPGVYKLLQNGRVYALQDFFGEKQDKCNCGDCYFDRYSEECITRALGDSRYVRKEQGQDKVGNIAIVDASGMVNFQSPSNIDFKATTADKIKDWSTNDYVTIDKVTNQLFRGNDLYGVHSGVERGEMLNFLSIVNMNWNPNYFYRKDTIINYVYVNDDGSWVLQHFIALRDNKNKNPLDNPEDWKAMGTVNADINEIVSIVYDRLVEKYDNEFQQYKVEINDLLDAFRGEVSENLQNFINDVTTNLIPNEIQNQLNNLPTVEYVSEGNSEILEFESEADFEAYKQAMEVDDSYFQDLESDGVYNVPVLRTNGFTPIIIDNLLDDIPYHSSFKTINIRFDLFLLDMNAPTQPLTSYVSINMSSILPNWQSRQVIVIPRKDDSGIPMFVLFKWTAVVTSNYKYNMMFEWEPINLTLEEQAGVILSLENMRVWTK